MKKEESPPEFIEELKNNLYSPPIPQIISKINEIIKFLNELRQEDYEEKLEKKK